MIVSTHSDGIYAAIARLSLPIVLQNGPGTVADKLRQKKYQTPDLKTKDGTIYRPLFSDQTELQKFARGKQMMALTLPFAVLEKSLPQGIKGYMLNPAGYQAVPEIIKTTALQLASLLWESAGGNLAVSSTTFADTGSRVFNNFTADRFLKQIAQYKRRF